MILSCCNPDSPTGRDYIPAEVSERHEEATLAHPVVVLMRSGEVLDEDTYHALGYRLESCMFRELPEIEAHFPWIDASDLSVMLSADGGRYIRSEALDLFGGES